MLLSWLISFAGNSEEPWLVVTEYLPPFQYPTENGHITGTMTNVVRDILQETELDADIVIMPWARAEHMAKNRPNTLIYSMLRTQKREDQFHWVGAIGMTTTSLFKLRSNHGLQLNSLSDIHRELIGVTRGDVVAKYLKGKLPLSNFQENITTSDSVRMLIFGRVDLIPTSEEQLHHYCLVLQCQTSQFDKVIDLDEVEQVLYLAANKDSDPKMLSILTKLTSDKTFSNGGG
ncbi:MAG: substrate-binding periplasmic protein [Aestuariibacter sp.]